MKIVRKPLQKKLFVWKNGPPGCPKIKIDVQNSDMDSPKKRSTFKITCHCQAKKVGEIYSILVLCLKFDFRQNTGQCEDGIICEQLEDIIMD